MVVRPGAILVATDRDRGEGDFETVVTNPGENPHDDIAAALRRFLPLGGRAVLIDNDTDHTTLDLRRPGGISLLDPHLLGVQSETDVELVTPHQALATAIHDNPAGYDLTSHAFNPANPFGMVTITEEAASANLILSVVSAEGVAKPAETPAPLSVTFNRAGLVAVELMSHLAREIPDAQPQIAICLITESPTFGTTLDSYFHSRLNSTPYPVRLVADRYVMLSGALRLAQHPLKV